MKNDAPTTTLTIRPLISPAEDPRVFRRYRTRLTALAQPTTEDGAHDQARPPAGPRPVVIRDLSTTGLFFTSGRPYPVGSLVEIGISLGTEPSPVRYLKAIVRRTQAAEAGGRFAYGHGVDFVRSPSLERARRAIADFLTSQPPADGEGDVPHAGGGEREWAEAYVQAHPDCELGQIYLMIVQTDTADPHIDGVKSPAA